VSRWWSRGLVGAGVVMLPWLVYLAVSLPGTARAAHWSAAWTGLDALEIAGLVGTGLLLRRPGPRARSAVTATAAATAALLVVDAWFDLTTAWTSQDLTSAIVLAACAELPGATLLAALAVRPVLAPPAATSATSAAGAAGATGATGAAGQRATVAYLDDARPGARIVGDGFRGADQVACRSVDDARDRAG
jgi:hypothetical protein